MSLLALELVTVGGRSQSMQGDLRGREHGRGRLCVLHHVQISSGGRSKPRELEQSC